MWQIGRLLRLLGQRILEPIVESGSSAICACVRRSTNTGFCRQSTVSIWPDCRFPISISTGEPRARALSLGSRDSMKGTAAMMMPIVPNAVVAAASRRRRCKSGDSATSATGSDGVAVKSWLMLTGRIGKAGCLALRESQPLLSSAPLVRIESDTTSMAASAWRSDTRRP